MPARREVRRRHRVRDELLHALRRAAAPEPPPPRSRSCAPSRRDRRRRAGPRAAPRRRRHCASVARSGLLGQALRRARAASRPSSGSGASAARPRSGSSRCSSSGRAARDLRPTASAAAWSAASSSSTEPSVELQVVRRAQQRDHRADRRGDLGIAIAGHEIATDDHRGREPALLDAVREQQAARPARLHVDVGQRHVEDARRVLEDLRDDAGRLLDREALLRLQLERLRRAGAQRDRGFPRQREDRADRRDPRRGGARMPTRPRRGCPSPCASRAAGTGGRAPARPCRPA